MTLSSLLIATDRNMLHILLALLDKAEAQLGAGRAEALLSARLTPRPPTGKPLAGARRARPGR